MIHWIRRKLHRLNVLPAAPTEVAGISRVEWKIGGSPLWFESADARLSHDAEAMACLCFAASSLAGWKTAFPRRICPDLFKRLERIGRIWGRWWKYETGNFTAKRLGKADAGPAGRATAVFLSLGVDSFYTLLRTPETGVIIYVAGYDVDLADTERLRAVEARLRHVAEVQGLRLIHMRTNLRQHPVFGKLSWDRFHGAALAAAGHLLAADVGRVLISSSFPETYFKPWGTSWKTDFLWSSAAVKFEHFGHDLWRFEKLELIADEPVVRENLRICWEHRNELLNCGLCEKCLRTMLGLLALGKLDAYPTFPGQDQLVIGLDASGPLTPHLVPTYQSFIDKGLPPAPDAAVRRLIERSRPAEKTKKQTNS